MSRGNRGKRDTYLQDLRSRLKSNIRSLTDNFDLIVQRAKCSDPTDSALKVNPYLQIEQDNYEMSVRAANIVHSCESLSRLVSEMKVLLILGDFQWLHEMTDNNKRMHTDQRLHYEKLMIDLRDQIADQIYLLEENSPNVASQNISS